MCLEAADDQLVDLLSLLHVAEALVQLEQRAVKYGQDPGNNVLLAGFLALLRAPQLTNEHLQVVLGHVDVGAAVDKVQYRHEADVDNVQVRDAVVLADRVLEQRVDDQVHAREDHGVGVEVHRLGDETQQPADVLRNPRLVAQCVHDYAEVLGQVLVREEAPRH